MWTKFSMLYYKPSGIATGGGLGGTGPHPTFEICLNLLRNWGGGVNTDPISCPAYYSQSNN